MPHGQQRAKNVRESYDDIVRALHLINGGGAVALLAFLGQIWQDIPELRLTLLWATAVLVLGVVMTSISTFLRLKESLHQQTQVTDPFINMRRRYHASLIASLLCFVIGLGILLWNLKDLATTPTRSADDMRGSDYRQGNGSSTSQPMTESPAPAPSSTPAPSPNPAPTPQV